MKRAIKTFKRVLSVLLDITFVLCCAYAVIIVVAATYRLLAPTPPPKVGTWQYKGHDMLRYEYKGEISICHSPACGKCCQIFD